jgi:hypothetical protein
MRTTTLRNISKLMVLVLLASFALEAPLFAAATPQAVQVKVGAETINVTPGQWVTVRNGSQVANYNVHIVNGKPVAMEMSQYYKFIFGNNTNVPTAVTNTPAVNTPVETGSGRTWSAAKTPAPSNTGTVAPNAPAIDANVADDIAMSQVQAADGAKGGNWVKQELADYGSKIKDSFTSGRETGQQFGTKTVDTVKSGASKVGTGVKSVGSKIGDLLKGAKERIAKIFHKNPPAAKGDSSQSGQQSGQGEQSGQSGQQSGQGEQTKGQPGQGEQSGQGGQQSGQTGQAGQSGQSGQSGQAGQADKPGFWDKTKAKMHSGYEAGKAMTNQGFSNVKQSLKSGFSPKNLLVTAGITVGVDLANQILSGEKPSLSKAVKVVASAEFAGGVVGSVTGAAAGSFFVPFLSAVPVVGGFLGALAPTFGSIVGGSVGSYLAGDLKNGRFSIKQAFKQIDWIGVGGQTVGSTLGAMLGSAILPPFGTIVGGIVGGWLGNKAAHWIAGLFGKGGNNNIGYPGLGAPVSTSASQEVPVVADVGMGAVDGGTGPAVEIPVSGSQAQSVAVAADQTMGDYGSEVQLAYAKYQELYRLYNELINQGRQEDAMKVAAEMNKAKAEYDALKAKASQ